MSGVSGTDRALKWSLPALISADAALVWGGFLGLADAVLVVVGVEALLLVVGGRQLYVAFRRYRDGRSEGLDAWKALEDGLAVLLPRKAARLVVLEPRLWTCLLRWSLRGTRPGANEFTYHRRSFAWAIVLMVVLVTPVELLVLELLIPWAWLRIVLLALEIYALFWVLGFYASLAAMPHLLEETGIRLRYGAFAEGFVPYEEISAVALARRGSPGPGDGLQEAPEEGAVYLAVGGKTDLTLKLRNPRRVDGLFRPARPTAVLHLAADEPGRLVGGLRRRLGAPATV